MKSVQSITSRLMTAKSDKEDLKRGKREFYEFS